MTSRERIIAALKGQPTDRMPWSPLIDDYFVSSLPNQGLYIPLLEAMRYIGVDILERHVPATREVYTNGVTYREEWPTGYRKKIYETPFGQLTEIRKHTGNTYVIVKHYIENLDDVKHFAYLAENTFFEPTADVFRERDNLVGESGIATPTGPMSPLQDLLQFCLGVEKTVYFLEDHEQEMRELLHAMHERNLRHYRALVEVSAEAYFDYEDTSTTVMNRRMMAEFSMPCIEDYSKIVQESGKLFITHMCGKLTGFIDLIGNLNVNGIDSLCPPNTGDLCAWDARAAWGTKKVIIGGMDPPALRFSTVEQALRTAAEIIAKMPSKQGFVLSTGDAVSYDTPIGNLCAVTELVKRLGGRALDARVDEDFLAQTEREVACLVKT